MGANKFKCGHPKTVENTVANGPRVTRCRQCRSVYSAGYHARRLKSVRRYGRYTFYRELQVFKCGHPRNVENTWIMPGGKRWPRTGCVKCRRATWKRFKWKGVNNVPSVVADACELCGRQVGLSMDHDHATREFRGWICPGCNIKLQWVEKLGIDTLAKYLTRGASKD